MGYLLKDSLLRVLSEQTKRQYISKEQYVGILRVVGSSGRFWCTLTETRGRF